MIVEECTFFRVKIKFTENIIYCITRTIKINHSKENLIDHSKPIIKYQGDEAYFKGLNYLLGTPFRYPPLR